MEEDKHITAKRATDVAAGGGWKPGIGLLLGLALIFLLLTGAIVLGLTTGIGLVFAVPLALVLIALGFVVFRGRMSPRAVAGVCPHCGAAVSAPEHIAELNCPACKRRIEIHDGGLLRAG